MDKRIGCGLYQFCGNKGFLDVCLGYGGVGGVGWKWVGGFGQ